MDVVTHYSYHGLAHSLAITVCRFECSRGLNDDITFIQLGWYNLLMVLCIPCDKHINDMWANLMVNFIICIDKIHQSHKSASEESHRARKT